MDSKEFFPVIVKPCGCHSTVEEAGMIQNFFFCAFLLIPASYMDILVSFSNAERDSEASVSVLRTYAVRMTEQSFSVVYI